MSLGSFESIELELSDIVCSSRLFRVVIVLDLIMARILA